MALYEKLWYVNGGDGVNSGGYWNVPTWQANHSYAFGDIVRPADGTIAVGNERCYIKLDIGTGTSNSGAQPNFSTTLHSQTTDNGQITWQEHTGLPGLNGDPYNNTTPTWTAYKAFTASSSGGQLIRDTANTTLFLCQSGGTMSGSEPTWNTSFGSQTTDGTSIWNSLGAISGWLTAWRAPHARLRNTDTWVQLNNIEPGATVAVYSGHKEIYTSQLNVNVGCSYTTPLEIVCIDAPGAVNPSRGANVYCNTTIVINNASGVCRMVGIDFNAGTLGATGSSVIQFGGGQAFTHYRDCGFSATGNTSTTINLSPSASLAPRAVAFEDCAFKFCDAQANGFAGTQVSATLYKFVNCRFDGNVVPRTLFSSVGGGNEVHLIGCDLSKHGSGYVIYGTNANGVFVIKDCVINPAVTLYGPPGGIVAERHVIRSDTSGLNHERATVHGVQSLERTVVRTGGANDGANSFSWKIVTNNAATAYPSWVRPFEAAPIAVWNDRTGANVTFTVYGIWDAGVVPNDDEVWIDVAYLGNTSSPRASFATSTISNGLAANSALASDSSTWGGSTTKFKMSVTVAPQQAGYAYVTAKFGKAAAATYYIDPKVELS